MKVKCTIFKKVTSEIEYDIDNIFLIHLNIYLSHVMKAKYPLITQENIKEILDASEDEDMDYCCMKYDVDFDTLDILQDEIWSYLDDVALETKPFNEYTQPDGMNLELVKE